MRYRIAGASMTGLGGNSAPPLIDSRPKDKKHNELMNRIAKDCYETFGFAKYGWCEAGVDGEEYRFGIEPSYMYEPLKLICISKDKDESRFITGRAVGPWASRCISTIKEYRDYQRKSKFVRFVDKWHPILYGTKA